MSQQETIAPLIVPPGEPDIGFRQGIVRAWDEKTGTNEIEVGGARLTNLPCLNIGEFVILQPGDVVGLLRFKTSYFILGRITPPLGPDNNRASIGAAAVGDYTRGFNISNVPYTTVFQRTVTIPAWADRAIVHLSVAATWYNTASNEQPFYLAATVNGLEGGDVITQCRSGYVAALANAAVRNITNPNPTITVAAQLWTYGDPSPALPPPNDAYNLVNVHASVVYWRVD